MKSDKPLDPRRLYGRRSRQSGMFIFFSRPWFELKVVGGGSTNRLMGNAVFSIKFYQLFSVPYIAPVEIRLPNNKQYFIEISTD